MKGPGVRIDLDVRRIWRCGRCGRIVRTTGNVTARRCRCTEEGAWMQLQPPVKREPYRPPPRAPDEIEPGEHEPTADQSPNEAGTIDATPPTGEPVIPEAGETVAAAIETVSVVSTENSPFPEPVEPQPPPEPRPPALADGFGAGVPEPLPPA